MAKPVVNVDAIADAPTTPIAGQVAGGQYFGGITGLERFPTGATMLDLVTGGGWPAGRIVNIVGDKSTGKTLLAIEAAANYARRFQGKRIRYAEAEAAFDVQYATTVGFPTTAELAKLVTIEELEGDFNKFCSEPNPGMYVLDSLDALTSDKKMEEGVVETGGYGMEKAKFLSNWFPTIVRKVEDLGVTLFIISQERDNINAGLFGKKSTRSGGRALDFYASFVLWLSHMGKIEITRGGVKRPIGIDVKAMTEKTKIGLPFRRCDLPIMFGYGVDSTRATLEYLLEVKRTQAAGMSEADAKRMILGLIDGEYTQAEINEANSMLDPVVKAVWADIEKAFVREVRKY